MVKKTSSKTKEKLLEENAYLRELLCERYCRQLDAIYTMRNGLPPCPLEHSKSWEEWCKNVGI
jgi:hypothetical protein